MEGWFRVDFEGHKRQEGLFCIRPLAVPRDRWRQRVFEELYSTWHWETDSISEEIKRLPKPAKC